MKKLPETWKQVKPKTGNHSGFPAEIAKQRRSPVKCKITKSDSDQTTNRTRFLGRIPVTSTPNANSNNFNRAPIPESRTDNDHDNQFQSASNVLRNKNAAAGRLDENCAIRQFEEKSFSCTFDNELINACDKLEQEQLRKTGEMCKAKLCNGKSSNDISDTNSTPSGDSNFPSLSLSSWNLPDCVVQKYNRNGVDCMFEWQRECLLLPGVLNGKNLVYSAPTSAGKTMVAEILLLKRVLEKKKKAIFVLPFVSVTREKTFYLQYMFQDAGVKVGGFMGGQYPPGGFAAIDVALCTIEKANNLVNRLIEEGSLNSLGIIVVDELHMLGDPSRGYLLELLLTKIIYLQSRKQIDVNGDTIAPMDPIQIIGMSATLPNLDLLAKWLQAALYRTDYRPIPLQECIKIGSTIYDSNIRKMKDIPISCTIPGDTEHVIQLCMEMVSSGHGTLVFCPSKKWCETLACNLAAEICKLGSDQRQDLNPDLQAVRDGLRLHLDGNSLQDVLEQLSRTPVGLDSVLKKTVSFGVAFHHAGLTFDERDVVEGAFRQGILKILVATSTLSSGVNLPARRVIIRTPMSHGNNLMDILAYRQMIGRAGRKGVDTEGESILLCKPDEGPKAKTLAQSHLPPVASCLVCDGTESFSGSLKRAILEIVVSGVAKTTREVEQYVCCTLLAASFESGEKLAARTNAVRGCVKYLEDNEFVKKTALDMSDEVNFTPTSLGSAVLASALSPNEGLVVFEELERARRNFVLENELHIVYQVTPIYVSSQWPTLDWLLYLDIWNRLPDGMKRVGSLVGVDEDFLQKAASGRVNKDDAAQRKCLDTHRRFYAALALHDLVNETPLSVVADKYGCNRGSLQSLQQSSSTFAGMVTVFCNRLGWVSLELLIAQFQSRLHFGVQRELIDLVRLPSLSGKYARFLYDRGLPTVAALANANVVDVEAILRNSRPFESERQRDGETARDAANRKERCCIRFPGKKGMTECEAAQVLITEARELVQKELGIRIDWKADIEPEPEHAPEIIPAVIRQPPIDAEPIGEEHEADVAKCQREEIMQAGLNSRDDGTVELDTIASTSPPTYVSQQAMQVLRRSQRCKRTTGRRNNRRNSRKNCRNTSSSSSSVVNGLMADGLFSAFQDKWKGGPFPTTSTNENTPVKTLGKNQQNLGPLLDSTPIKNPLSPLLPVSGVCGEDGEGSSRSPIIFPAHHSSPFSWDAAGKQCPLMDASSLLRCEQTPSVDKNKSRDKTFSWGSSGLEECMLKNFQYDEPDKAKDVDEVRDSCTDSDATNCSLELFTNSMQMIENSIDNDTSKRDAAGGAAGTRSPLNSFLRRSFNMSSLEFKPNLDAIMTDSQSNGGFYNDDRRKRESEHDCVSISPKRANNTEEEDVCMSPTPNDVIEQESQVMDEDGEFTIIDVTADKELFRRFIEEWKTKKEFSVSVACEPKPENVTRAGDIGMNRASKPRSTANKDKDLIVYNQNVIIVGLAVCWEGNVAYYVALRESFTSEETDEGLVPPPPCVNLSTAEIITGITEVMSLVDRARRSIFFDAKPQMKCIREMTGVLPNFLPKDPKIAEWLLEPTGRERSLATLVSEFLADYSPLLSAIPNLKGVGSIALDTRSTVSGRVRATTEAVVTHHLMVVLEDQLRNKDLHRTFIDIEMPIVSILAKMEMNGFGFSVERCQQLQNCLHSKLRNLEEEAYGMAGRRFSLTSPKELAQVLYVELSLPPSGNFQDVRASLRRNIRSPRITMGKTPKLPKNYTVTKDGLEKLAQLHRMPAIILEWRKISSALSKVIVPLLKLNTFNPLLAMHRMHGNCLTHTATGRITMSEPNLQNVHRDFEVSIPLIESSKGHQALNSGRYAAIAAMSPYRTRASSVCGAADIENISIRHVFIPFQGGVLLSADYCQLELRILAHLSKDSYLLKALTDGRDAFRTMAAQWKDVAYEQVTDADRQQAKHICYGMIYGMGPKALGEQLRVSEADAAIFITTFKDKYPGVKAFLNSSVESCRKCGYVETMFGRRRYIPMILSATSHWRSQAERQAVNTPIQGSAADLVKEAMVAIDVELANAFRGNRYSHKNPQSQPKATQTGFLVLQLHDELIYEVNESDLIQVAQIVKMKMEETAKISMPLPVRMRAGPSWASLQDLDL